jgi:acyl-CoA reductase-like NAD-dependent aldehyde dehydrogenase
MKMIIGGKHVDASDKATMDVINPATLEVIDTVPFATHEDVSLALKNAQAGFREWSQMPLYERIRILYKFADILEERMEELVKIDCRESGKAISLCRGETIEALVIFRGYCEKARNFGGEVLPLDTEKRIENDLIITVREPIGVVGCIIPFNYPVELFAHKVAPALVVGNTVVIKPASDTPMASILMTEWLLEAGVPANAAQIVTGSGSKVGKWMVESPDTNMITLTGSTEVGIETMHGCSDKLHHCHLELGGNDPFIIFDDCDLDKAVEESIGGRCSNAGQTCCANKRFIVQNTIKDKYIEKMIEGLKKVKVGDPMQEDTFYGSMISEKAAIEVEKQVQHTVAQGAKCAYGGKRFNRTFFEPTLLTDVTPDMDVAKDLEIFGPVIPVIGFDTVEEAIEIANNIPYGLSSGVMTNDMKKAMKVSRSIQSGCCVVNGSGNYRSAHQAFGGYKMTGIGREGVAYTLEEMTQKKTIAFKQIF